MEIGLTVGDSIERLDATAGGFDFAELSIGESYAPGTSDDELRDALAASDAELCVHLPYEQVLTSSHP